MVPLNKAQALEYIRSMVTEPEQLAALAEEASELAQAALKYRRTLIDGNPTPMTQRDAFHALLEELGDVAACLEVLNLEPSRNATINTTINIVRNTKIRRWADRLREKKGGDLHGQINNQSGSDL